jgi:uncharacterized RDD family membrane protein YckC
MTEQLSDTRTIAGFWRRWAAFLLDVLALGIVGWIAGLFLAETFIRLGAWGRLLGFSVSLVYFGVLNSRLANGQTLGKKLLKIKVVSRSGSPLSVASAFLRFLPIGAPWFLNNAQLPGYILFSAWIYILGILVFGVGLSVLYLYLFNRTSRQSLHDLIVGSYVVTSNATSPVPAKAPGKGHLVVCTILVVASGVVPFFMKKLVADEPFLSLMKVYHAVSAEPFVLSAQVNKGMNFASKSAPEKNTHDFLSVIAYCKEPDIENPELAKRLALLAISADSSIKSLDSIQITLVYGYDIGIASAWNSQGYLYPPAELIEQQEVRVLK